MKAPKKCILVVGGAGFIGSYINEVLNRKGYQTVVLDKLIRGHRAAVQQGRFIEGDYGNAELLDHIFESTTVDAVMHFGALTDVGESVSDPLVYYINNVAKTLNLLEAMKEHQIRTFIFSSSAAVYGMPGEDVVAESHSCHPINPYGQSKLMIETVLQDCEAAYGLRYCSLRYFNAAGGDPEGKIKNFNVNGGNLIPIVLRKLQREDDHFTLFGGDYSTPDGTCIRDFIHIDDLALAHIAAMEKLFAGASSSCYNLGNGIGYSVRQVVEAAEKITGKKLPLVEGPRRQGDPPKLVANAQRAQRELDWTPQYNSLEKMIKDAWRALSIHDEII